MKFHEVLKGSSNESSEPVRWLSSASRVPTTVSPGSSKICRFGRQKPTDYIVWCGWHLKCALSLSLSRKSSGTMCKESWVRFLIWATQCTTGFFCSFTLTASNMSIKDCQSTATLDGSNVPVSCLHNRPVSFPVSNRSRSDPSDEAGKSRLGAKDHVEVFLAGHMNKNNKILDCSDSCRTTKIDPKQMFNPVAWKKVPTIWCHFAQGNHRACHVLPQFLAWSNSFCSSKTTSSLGNLWELWGPGLLANNGKSTRKPPTTEIPRIW